jgi:alanine-glyoxylate transaminase/serine-glyoxylate transaminase/serine-pyruvate transaminase
MSSLPPRLLLGPGPSNVPPRVLAALAEPLLGHLDPAFLSIADEVQQRLRDLFGTANRLTIPLSSTGSGGMEACFANLIEPGDRVLVGVAGVFGERMREVAHRHGARVSAVEAEWGRVLDEGAMLEAIERDQPDLVAFVHAETSTGVRQPVDRIALAARATGALVVLDCVTSLGGLPVTLDEWGIDAAYSATQKCLSCPPGLAPASFSERARERVVRRRTPVSSWYFDTSLLGGYYGAQRVYHHTAPVGLVVGLAEGLRILDEEGLSARFERHARAGARLVAELEAFGFEPLVASEHRLPMLSALRLPEAIVRAGEADLRRRLLEDHGIEVGGGLGKLAGSIWRIGLMGENARDAVIDRLLSAVEKTIGAGSSSRGPVAGRNR